MTIPIFFIIRGFTREVILSSILQIYGIARIYINSLPQPLVWALFIAIVVILAGRSMLKPSATSLARTNDQELRLGRVTNLAQSIRRTTQGDYFKWRLAQHLLDLSLDVIAYQKRATPSSVRQLLKSGDLVAPPEIVAYLRSGMTQVHSARQGILGRIKAFFMAPDRDRPLNLEPELVVAFLEEQLEIDHEI
jgi:hypothetical protein